MRMKNISQQVAQRTCVVCRKVKAKQELVRLVRSSDGNIEVDTTGKKPGRGAYLCRMAECWEAGSKSNRLEHALRANFTQDTREQLVRYGKELFLSE
jgi:predicted RNA-binding protein YlxR (DUF448 family)